MVSYDFRMISYDFPMISWDFPIGLFLGEHDWYSQVVNIGGAPCAKGLGSVQVQAKCARTGTDHLVGKYQDFRIMLCGPFHMLAEDKK